MAIKKQVYLCFLGKKKLFKLFAFLTVGQNCPRVERTGTTLPSSGHVRAGACPFSDTTTEPTLSILSPPTMSSSCITNLEFSLFLLTSQSVLYSSTFINSDNNPAIFLFFSILLGTGLHPQSVVRVVPTPPNGTDAGVQ